jgi:uncharacterized protein (DUF2461 family)
VKTAEAVGLSMTQPELKRPPRGYSADHPRLEGLRLKELTVFQRHELEPWIHTPKCDQRIRAQLDGARPLVKWIGEVVGPSRRPQQR